MCTVNLNEELNGIEISFESKPDQATINLLKSESFRWHNVKKVWYAKQTAERLEIANKLSDGEIVTTNAAPKAKLTYGIQISDYITKEEFEQSCREYYEKQNRDQADTERCIEYAVKNYYNNESKYYNLSEYIRQAIIWKTIGGTAKDFDCNANNVKFAAVWDKLPTIEGIKKTDKKYSAMWGYDQTQITTATYYGKAFGLDVLISGGYGGGEVLLKRIAKDGTFKDGCKYFGINRFSDEEIRETNEYVMYHGR